MKKIIVLATLVLTPLATMAASQDVCTGTSGTSSVTVNSVLGTDFIKVGFKPQCSTDTYVRVDQNTTALWGASISLKGKNYFTGSTNGGAIKPIACAADPCTAATDVTAGLTAAALLTGT